MCVAALPGLVLHAVVAAVAVAEHKVLADAETGSGNKLGAVLCAEGESQDPGSDTWVAK